MNQQALSYHTRLHDWYRQHSIQQEKHTELRALPKQTKPSTDAIASGILTRDKLHFIDEWCTDVNRNMFSIKKKEASPLYRKCRLSAPIKAAMKDRLAATRRVRSAEVFTVRGEWDKAPKANVQGGELLAKANRNSASHSEKRGAKECDPNDTSGMRNGISNDNMDFCVTNSMDKSNDATSTMARVNHDSFDRRIHPSIIKKAANTHLVISPRGYHNAESGNISDKAEKDFPTPSTQARAKSASVLRPPQHDKVTVDNYQARHGSAKTLPTGHKVSDGQNDSGKAQEAEKQKQRVTSASQKSLKASTDLNTSLGDAEIRGILNATEPDNGKVGYPTFCGKCSGIYAGNAPPPPTPVTCGSCVHGITMNGKQNGQSETGPSNAEIQKELAQRLVQTEKLYNSKITNANIQLKMSESRVTEDSVHYNKEREIVRDGQPKSSLLLLKSDDDFPDDADLSIQNCDDDNDISFDILENNGVHDEERGTLQENEDKVEHKTEGTKKIPIVTILTDDEHDVETANESMDKRDSIVIDDDKLSASFEKRRGGRRMSIHFTYKPEVGNISISNNLLHFLSIDDCKQAMRYHPHKVLEKHEVTDNSLLMLANSLAMQSAYGDGDNETASSTGKVAMRISKGSTITTLPSSSANNATNANKKQYKILFDPEDFDYYKNKKPNSVSLTKAFNTLIYDRTIMQRLENKSSGLKTKALNNVGKTTEGPKYRLINAAMKKQMGEKMQAQCQQMVHRYQRRKSGLYSTKRQAQTGTLSQQSSERSLSLESLPSVRRGIWRESNESLH